MTDIHVVAAVIEHSGRFLLAQRPAGKSLAGYWEFPGGKVELGENPRDALRRELQEELMATSVVVGASVGCQRHDYGDVQILLDAYHVSCDADSLVAREHDSLRWFAADELRSIRLAPADEFVVRLIASPR
jgi:8-oxo-dGTP diphosphatase